MSYDLSWLEEKSNEKSKNIHKDIENQKSLLHLDQKKKDSKLNIVSYKNTNNNIITYSNVNITINHQIIAITDEKIRNIVDRRLLKLLKFGLNHKLIPENLIQYFKEVGKSKLYELRRYFSDSKVLEIELILKFLLQNNIVKKEKNLFLELINIYIYLYITEHLIILGQK